DALQSDNSLVEDSTLNDCHYLDAQAYGRTDAMHVAVSSAPGGATANLYGSGMNPLEPFPIFTPSIDWNITVTVSTANPVFPVYTVEYTHDCFPAFEVYIGTQLIHGTLPTAYDVTTITACLEGAFPVVGSAVGPIQ
ncbi:MAG TPA: hypothetical protein VKV15_25715, partial [Bryobacteraceae bacterium]|nr:hypothetical protein [Bryobacteraceae bacterium]